MTFKFWQRHTVLAKDNKEIVINYNCITKKVKDAALFVDGSLAKHSHDYDTIMGWIR